MLCSQLERVGDMPTRLGTDHSYKVSSKSDKRFEIFLFLALAAMLFSQAEHVGSN